MAWLRQHPVVAAIVGALLFALIAGLLWWNVSASRGPSNAAPPVGPAATVIMIPGYGGDAGSLATMRSQLTATGARVILLDIGDGEGDIAGYAAELQALTAQVTGPVAWVGYSMGGLVARAAYSAETAPLVSSITSIGSPLQGTKSAALAQFVNSCPTACQQMTPGSDFLTNLLAWPNPAASWVSIYSPEDDVIRPYTSSELKKPDVTNIDLANCSPPSTPTHSDLPRDPEVLALTTANVVGDPVSC